MLDARKPMTQIGLCGLLVAVVVLLGGCGGGATVGHAADPAGTAPALSVPNLELPAPADLAGLTDVPRRGSYVEEGLIRHGKDYEGGLLNRNVGISNDNAKFSTDWSEASGMTPANLGIAMYLFDLPGYDRAAEVRYGWDAPPAVIDSAWLGLGNQDNNSWDLFPCNAGGLLSVPSFDPYISAADTLLVVFVLANEGISALRYVRLGPHVVEAQLSATSQGIVPFTATLNAGASSSAVGTLDLFEWDYDGDGTFDGDTGSMSSTTHGYTDTGIYQPVVRITNSYGVSDTATDMITAVDPWTTTWGRKYTDQLNAINWDSDGNIYAVGQSGHPDTGTPQLLLAKFAPYGELVWAKSWAVNSAARGDSGSFGTEIRMDGNGDLYVMGGYGTPEGNIPRLLMQKWSAAGELLWSKSWGGAADSFTAGEALLHVSGVLYVVGFTDEFSGNNDIALFKLSADGEITWLKTYGGTGSDTAVDAAVSGLLFPTGITVAGSTNSFGAPDIDVLLMNFNLDGDVILEQRWAMADIQFAHSLYLEVSGEAYLAGHTLNAPHDADVLLLGVNELGTEIFKSTWGTTGYDRPLCVRRASGMTYFCGEGYKQSGDSWYGLLLQLDGNGDEIAAQTWKAAGDPDDNFVQMYFYGGGLLLCGQADEAGGTSMAISGAVDKNPAGSWQAVSGTVVEQAASMATAEGTVTDITGDGVIDTGAGEPDALLMLTEFP